MTRNEESREWGMEGCVQGVEMLDWANTRTLGWCWVWFLCLWRPGGAFLQIGFGCVISHHHMEGPCTFLFKFWREIQNGLPANS